MENVKHLKEKQEQHNLLQNIEKNLKELQKMETECKNETEIDNETEPENNNCTNEFIRYFIQRTE